METKLTLKLDADLIEKAKKYAKDHDESLSKVVENFFRFLPEGSENSQTETELSAWTKSLMSEKTHDPDFDMKEFKYNRLKEKHGL